MTGINRLALHSVVCPAALVCLFVLTMPCAGQTQWFKYTGNPVMRLGSAGAWDDASVYPSRVLKEDSTYRMWYTGWDGSFWRAGHATSPDGVTWTGAAQNPILREGPGSWENAGVSEPYVLFDGSGYRMWYRGEDFLENWRIGYAVSPDGLSWAKVDSVNPVLTSGSWYQRGPNSPAVLPDVRWDAMWFTAEPTAHAYFQIGRAISTYLAPARWEPDSTPALSYGVPGSWDDHKVFFPRVMWVGGLGAGMWYIGERKDARSQIGYATSQEGDVWTRDESNPVITRGPASWDKQDLYGLDVLKLDDMYHMWYGGMSSFPAPPDGIGYAVSPKGISVSVAPQHNSLDRNQDTIRVVVRLAPGASALTFFLELESPEEHPLDTLRLYDDGAHRDSLAADGVYANSWVPGPLNYYQLDLLLRLDNALMFEKNNVATYTPVVAVNAASPIAPTKIALSQNYPNPFNPSTIISYQLPAATLVRLAVYDLLGRELAVLANERKAAGRHEVRWDATGFPSGIYVCRMTAGSYSSARKLILMK